MPTVVFHPPFAGYLYFFHPLILGGKLVCFFSLTTPGNPPSLLSLLFNGGGWVGARWRLSLALTYDNSSRMHPSTFPVYDDVSFPQCTVSIFRELFVCSNTQDKKAYSVARIASIRTAMHEMLPPPARHNKLSLTKKRKGKLLVFPSFFSGRSIFFAPSS